MSTVANIGDLREAYRPPEDAFKEDELVRKEPFAQFESWYEEAKHCGKVQLPIYMHLATCDKAGRPSVRPIQLSDFNKEGFVFFTSESSRKAKDIEENPFCSIAFYWDILRRSVRIEGKAQKMSEVNAQKFWGTPSLSHIAACSSKQDILLKSRQKLEEEYKDLMQNYPEDAIAPIPDSWHGYLVIPDMFEFWQGQSNRLHDRICFTRASCIEKFDPEVMREGEDGWTYWRMFP